MTEGSRLSFPEFVAHSITYGAAPRQRLATACRVDFKTGKVVASKTGMIFMLSRRPKLIQPGCFEGPAAAWAPRRDTSSFSHRLLYTFGLLVNTTFGDVPFSGLST